MPQFYFNVFDGRSFPDSEGADLPDRRAAQVLAIQHAGEVLQSDAAHIAQGDEWHMEVTDERGLILFRLDFSVSASSALTDAPASLDKWAHRGPKAS